MADHEMTDIDSPSSLRPNTGNTRPSIAESFCDWKPGTEWDSEEGCELRCLGDERFGDYSAFVRARKMVSERLQRQMPADDTQRRPPQENLLARVLKQVPVQESSFFGALEPHAGHFSPLSDDWATALKDAIAEIQTFLDGSDLETGVIASALALEGEEQEGLTWRDAFLRTEADPTAGQTLLETPANEQAHSDTPETVIASALSSLDGDHKQAEELSGEYKNMLLSIQNSLWDLTERFSEALNRLQTDHSSVPPARAREQWPETNPSDPRFRGALDHDQDYKEDIPGDRSRLSILDRELMSQVKAWRQQRSQRSQRSKHQKSASIGQVRSSSKRLPTDPSSTTKASSSSGIRKRDRRGTL